MKLLCDLGHSRIKWAVLKEGLCDEGAAHYASPDGFLALTALARPDEIAAISVSGRGTAAFAAFCESHWGRVPTWYGTCGEGFGVRNLYHVPETLGADRFAALVGARARYRGRSVCVVDCGTAMTIDALDGEGNFQGGVILAGLATSTQALAGIGPQLAVPHIACEDDTVSVLGRSTATAIAAGVLVGAAGAIERIYRDQCALLSSGSETMLLLTGGDAQAIAPYIGYPHVYLPHLTLEGLAVMAS